MHQFEKFSSKRDGLFDSKTIIDITIDWVVIYVPKKVKNDRIFCIYLVLHTLRGCGEWGLCRYNRYLLFRSGLVFELDYTLD